MGLSDEEKQRIEEEERYRLELRRTRDVPPEVEPTPDRKI